MIRTYSGIEFDVLNPKIGQVGLEDIAHALSNICRFAGHTRTFYSVAEHCVWVSRMVPSQYALHGLLHDASEAYVQDMPAPIKRTPNLEGYRAIENKLQHVIFTAFGLTPVIPSEVHEADSRMAATEATDLFDPVPKWAVGRGYQVEVHAWGPTRAKEQYLRRFYELYGSQRKVAVA